MVLLQRRLALPLPFSNRTCRCGRPLDAFGHHRAACARCGVLGRRGFALESAAGRVCREAGARVATNQFVRDLDLGVPNANDNRRLEVVADGLPLFGGVQLAVDTTLISAGWGDGEPVPGAADRDCVALRRARRRKEATYPELIRAGARARLVVLGMEVGGRWSKEARTFVQMLAKARVSQIPPCCSVAWSKRGVRGSQGVRSFLVGIPRRAWCLGVTPPSFEVERDQRYAILCG